MRLLRPRGAPAWARLAAALAVLAMAGLPGFAASTSAAQSAAGSDAVGSDAAGSDAAGAAAARSDAAGSDAAGARSGAAATGSGAAATRSDATSAFGKPVAPFSIEAEAVEPSAVGVPVGVQVRLVTRVRVEDIEVRISADEGLSVDLADLTLRAPSASPEQPAEWLISVVPLANGAQRLRLYGEALIDGRRQGRSVVATIRVGVAEQAKGDSGAEAESSVSAATSNNETNAREDEPSAERVIRLPSTPQP